MRESPEKKAALQAAVAELAQQLHGWAEAAAAIPVPHFCNNPGCSTASGVSEVALVSGKSCMCGGCKVARYCSKGCQTKHWKVHKPACKALAAAATAAETAAAISRKSRGQRK